MSDKLGSELKTFHHRLIVRTLFLVLLILSIALFATNPGPEVHRAAIKEEMRQHTANMEGSGLERAITRFSVEIGLVDVVINSQFSYDNYGFFSIGNLGEKRGVTIGILGQAITGNQIERWTKSQQTDAQEAFKASR